MFNVAVRKNNSYTYLDFKFKNLVDVSRFISSMQIWKNSDFEILITWVDNVNDDEQEDEDVQS